MLHAVYTLEKTVALGGHFYTNEAMRLSYWSRLALQHVRGLGTNAYNECVIRHFSRMAMFIAPRGFPGTSSISHYVEI
jgi:hypothetical protein